MPLRCPRFSGDPVLERCFAATHRMLLNEDGLAVMRVQAALIELGIPIGAPTPTGFFGEGTGSAVTTYKTRKNLRPNDPVVGPGTSAALDDDFFVDPPELDRTFAEFSPAVVAHRVEPFVALELASFISAPLDSWRRMLARSALAMLNADFLTGIVAQTTDPATNRASDLRPFFLRVAAIVQPTGQSAEDFFDTETQTPTRSSGLGVTIDFMRSDGTPASFVLIGDRVILGRAVTTRSSTGETVAETTRSVTLHELVHVRNAAISALLRQTADSDTTTYADTALAAQASTGVLAAFPPGVPIQPTPTANVFDQFVAEICARHIEWIVEREAGGDPGAITALTPAELASAVIFYFVELAGMFGDNGYIAGINAQGDAMRAQQLNLWLRRCSESLLSDDPSEDARTTQLFIDAGQACVDLLTGPGLEFPEAKGLRPLPQDFS